MQTESETLELLRPFLTSRIESPSEHVKELRGKALKSEFKRFSKILQPGDELWNYHWSLDRGSSYSYEYGWCIIRGTVLIAKHFIHCS